MKTSRTITTLFYIAFHFLLLLEDSRQCEPYSRVPENKPTVTRLWKSLECYTDFNTQVTCTWTENKYVKTFVNISFCILSDYSICNVCQSKELMEETNGNITWKCVDKSRYSFYLSTWLKYAFSPDQNFNIALNLSSEDSLLEEQRKPELYATETAYYLRMSEASKRLFLGNSSAEISQCEIQYRNETEKWEESSKGECKDSWGSISKALLSGVQYYARMRVNAGIDKLSWSNWSSEIRFETKETGYDANPQNLRCSLHETEILECSWAVRKEVMDSVSFQLTFKQNQDSKDRVCDPECHEMMQNLPYQSCRCSIASVRLNPQILSVVRIQSEKEGKHFLACSNVQLPPANLTLKELDEGEVVFNWNIPTERKGYTFEKKFEFCYWTNDDYKLDKTNRHPLHCPTNAMEIPHGTHSEVRLKSDRDLKPLTTYHAMIRTRVKHSSCCFNGPWSEWSGIQTWKSKAVPKKSWILYVIIPCSIMLIVCGVFGTKHLARYKKEWEENIPDPKKSFIILNFQHKMEKSSSIFTKHHPYEEIFSSCSAVPDSSLLVSKDIADCKKNEETPGSTNSGQIHENKTYCFLPEMVQKNGTETDNAVIGTGYQAFSELVNDHDHVDSGTSNIALPSFDGPYLLCPSNP